MLHRYRLGVALALWGGAVLVPQMARAQAQPVINLSGEDFSGLPTVAPGAVAIVLGSNFVDVPGTDPGSTKVLVNGASAQIAFLEKSPTYGDRATFQIPVQTGLGIARVVVSHAGISSAPFTVQVSQFAPELWGFTFANDSMVIAYHANGSRISATDAASPGERLKCVVSGLGASDPPPAPALTVAGIPVVVESLQSHDPVYNFAGVYAVTFTVPAALGSGSFPLTISLNGMTGNTHLLPVVSSGLILSQTGATFRAVTGSSTPQQRGIFVIAAGQTISWAATVSTISGGSWLQVTSATGTSDPSKAPSSIQISATAANLPPGDYYGTVTIKPEGTNSAQIISVVLSVLPPDQSPGTTVEPTGLVFVADPSAAGPSAQTVQITNPSTTNLSFTTIASVPSGPVWFKFAPANGTVPPGQPFNISVQPAASLSAGVYPGTLTFQFSDGKARVVNLLFIVAAGATTSGAAPLDVPSLRDGARSPQAGCTPTKLLPVFTLLGVNFSSPVAWPTPIQAQILDDCGNPAKAGSVSLTFSNGDPSLGLTSLQNGTWFNTWVPRNSVTSALVVTLKAQLFTPALEGTTKVSGSAPPNPNVPIISFGGVVGTASYAASPAPGTLISLFGKELADGVVQADALPLPNRLGATSLLIGGVIVPLVFVSESQVNALIPYALRTKEKYQVIVRRGSAISAPETIAVLDAQPAVFTTDQTGKGQGHIYKIKTDGAQVLAAPSSSVSAGDVLTIYCTGLGEVNPPVEAGSAAPLTTLEPTVNPVTVTIGGVNAPVLFAGLAPGFTGLYQVNVVVPDGIIAGDNVPVTISVAGQASLPVSIATR